MWRVNRVEVIRPLTVAGAAQAGRQRCVQRAFFLLPVELQPVNQAASTNSADFTVLQKVPPYNRRLYRFFAPDAADAPLVFL